jgi:hypothetical protein
MSDDVIDFVGAKTKATTTIELNGKPFDFDAWLVQRGYDRATIDALFAKYVPNEADAPEVVFQRKLLELHRERRIPLLREAVAAAIANLNAAIDQERNLEAQVTLSKAIALDALARRARAVLDGGKPKGRRPRR